MKTPIFDSNAFDWRKGEGTSALPRLGQRDFPKEFYIRSARTGQQRLFLYDGATMEENEFFDGECTAYMVPGQNVRAYIWC